jgi:hypothetical protein
MANHGFISTRRNLTPEILYDALVGISRERFDGKIEIVRDTGWGWGSCSIRIADDQSCPYWLKSRRKIETAHKCWGSLGWWIQTVFINDLAVRFDGTISDEGVREKWRGRKGKYPTFRKMLQEKLGRSYHTVLSRLATRIANAQSLRWAKQIRPDLEPYF